MEVGLDLEALDFTIESIEEFARRELPESRLIELDERDEFPEELVRRMCGEELGIQLLFIPEEYGGMGGAAVDVYRVCEAHGRDRPRRRDRRSWRRSSAPTRSPSAAPPSRRSAG